MSPKYIFKLNIERIIQAQIYVFFGGISLDTEILHNAHIERKKIM